MRSRQKKSKIQVGTNSSCSSDSSEKVRVLAVGSTLDCSATNSHGRALDEEVVVGLLSCGDNLPKIVDRHEEIAPPCNPNPKMFPSKAVAKMSKSDVVRLLGVLDVQVPPNHDLNSLRNLLLVELKSRHESMLDPLSVGLYSEDVLRGLLYSLGRSPRANLDRKSLLEELQKLRNEAATWTNGSVAARLVLHRMSAGPKPTIKKGKDSSYYANLFLTPLINMVHHATLQYASRRGHSWSRTNGVSIEPKFAELKRFILLNMYIMCWKAEHESISELWSVERGDLVCRQATTRERFTELRRYFHIGLVEDDDAPFFSKVDPIIDLFNNISRTHWNHYNSLALDEDLWGFKGRAQGIQRMPAKPDKFGFRIWKLVDKAHYCLKIMVYEGKGTGMGDDGTEMLCEETVRRMTQEVTSQRGHGTGAQLHLFADNYFGTVRIAEELLRQNVFFTGTMRTNRKDLPASVIVRSLRPGEVSAQSKPVLSSTGAMIGNVNFMKWRDKSKEVAVLSTAFSSGLTANGIPRAIQAYRHGMRYVDTNDQHSKLFRRRRFRKWWHVFFFKIVGLMLINAWILHSYTRPRRGNSKEFPTLKAFFQDLILSELLDSSGQVISTRIRSPSFIASTPTAPQSIRQTAPPSSPSKFPSRQSSDPSPMYTDVLVVSEARNCCKCRRLVATLHCPCCDAGYCAKCSADRPASDNSI